MSSSINNNRSTNDFNNDNQPTPADLGSLGEKVMKLSSQDFHGFFSGSRTKITLNKVSVERGLSWRDAEKIYHSLDGENEGFYVSKQVCHWSLCFYLFLVLFISLSVQALFFC